MIVVVFIFALLIPILLRRYLAVLGIPAINLEQESLRENIVRLDLRDYNVAASYPINNVYVLPNAYLKRHYREIEKKNLVLVASDPISLNHGIRFLQRKGFTIIGYYLPDRQIS